MSNATNTGLSFDASAVKPQDSFDLLPNGWQNVEVTNVKVTATKGRGAGQRTVFEFTILGGDFAGRKVWDGINNKNASAACQEIGQRALSAICHATGVMVVTDANQFVGKQLQIKVGIEKGSEGYSDKNVPKGYKALEGAAVAPTGPPTPVAGMIDPAAVPATAAPPVVETFPPEGWLEHPSAPGHYYKGQEVLTEADLRATMAPPAPAVPAPPAAAPAAPAAAAPAATAPPAAATGASPPWATPAQ